MRRRVREKYLDFKHLTLGIPRLELRPTDCLVVSWPRSGNTWLRYMLHHALFPDRDWDLLAIDQRMPIVDHPDLKRILKQVPERPCRMFKSHEAFQPYYLKGRVVYLIRDGRDATLSMYHYRTKLNRQDYRLSEFICQSLAGQFRYGSWHENVQSWLAHEKDPAILILRYESLMADPQGELTRVLEHFDLVVSSQRMDAAIERSCVDRVNEGFQKYAAQKNRTFSGGTGGGSGKWQDAFADEDRALFEKCAGDLLCRLGYA